jgi:hypothetical protein
MVAMDAHVRPVRPRAAHLARPVAVLVAGLLVTRLAAAPAAAECLMDEVDTGIPCGTIAPQGCCYDSATVMYCGGTTLCAYECFFSGCGWDGLWEFYDCGLLIAGRADPTGANPYSCGGGGGVTPGVPCGDITWEGCCEGQTLRYCYDGSLGTIDCSANSDPSGQYCGWIGADGYDCTSAPTEGALPRACGGSVCTPSCGARQCGDDGCGGSCGTCTGGRVCSPAGVCESACEPQCGDRVCGPDPVCGLSCGTCAAGLVCNTALNACVSTCTPSCAGRSCGDNGCGGQCGVCGAGEACVSYRCVSDCVPVCVGRMCGDNGCGGSCGTCAAGQSCVSGQCQACVPSCEGRECGADGCGGTCGECHDGQVCDAEYALCVTDPTCIPQCTGRACGNDGCGGMCGACGIDFHCVDGRCISNTCRPQCEGRQCGDDGCGGTCGACADDADCDADGRCPDVKPPDGDDPPDPIDDPGDGTDDDPADDPPGGPDDEPGAPTDECPPGTTLRYGVCVAGDLSGNPGRGLAGAGDAAGGCALGAPAGPTSALLLLLLLALLAPALRRR